jgi:hypothetical protein
MRILVVIRLVMAESGEVGRVWDVVRLVMSGTEQSVTRVQVVVLIVVGRTAYEGIVVHVGYLLEDDEASR